MDNIEGKLDYLENTKSIIKTSIENKGISIPDVTPFREYANAIDSISSTKIEDVPTDNVKYSRKNSEWIPSEYIDEIVESVEWEPLLSSVFPARIITGTSYSVNKNKCVLLLSNESNKNKHLCIIDSDKTITFSPLIPSTTNHTSPHVREGNICISNKGTIFLLRIDVGSGTDRGIVKLQRSTDSGNTWTNVTLPTITGAVANSYIPGWNFIQAANNRLYILSINAGVEAKEILTSTDDGITWTKVTGTAIKGTICCAEGNLNNVMVSAINNANQCFMYSLTNTNVITTLATSGFYANTFVSTNIFFPTITTTANLNRASFTLLTGLGSNIPVKTDAPSGGSIGGTMNNVVKVDYRTANIFSTNLNANSLIGTNSYVMVECSDIRDSNQKYIAILDTNCKFMRLIKVPKEILLNYNKFICFDDKIFIIIYDVQNNQISQIYCAEI